VKTILLLGHHDVRVLLRDRTAYIWLIAVPLAFVWFMSLAVRGPGGPAVARPTVLIDNRDQGFMGEVFLRELGAQDLKVVGPEKAGEAKRGITIPPDFTERVHARERVKLEFFTLAGSDDGSAALVEVRLARALLTLNTRLAEHALGGGDALVTEEALVALGERPDAVALQTSHAGRKPRPVGFGFSLPGNLVGYLFLNLLIFGGASVAEQRRTGILRRLAMYPVTKTQLLFGKIYGLLLLGGVQSAALLLVGEVIFGLAIAENLPGILLTLVVFSWVAASLGVLVGCLIQAEDKVIGVCLAIALPTAAIGGCWWPLEIAPPIFRHLAHAVPAGWALDALHQLITFGGGLAQALPAVGVLVLFGLGANAIAARFFRL
jgi:ABC-2 type transport system permease protein